jgi:DNA-binding response OmpR family regulator
MKLKSKTANSPLKNKAAHIFVIDDDDFLLSAVKKKLQLANYKVTVSNNVHDAHFKLSMIEPDLIMLDIIMPEINGLEFMDLINKRLTGSNTPIILMSYLPKNKLFEMGYGIGSAHYLPKPFDLDKLPFLLNNAILKS